jgi:ribosomal protein S18 acetylase RimI-like enzyme
MAAQEGFTGAFKEEKLVGVLSLCTCEDGCGVNISSLVVLPDFQRRGIGRALLAAVTEKHGSTGITVQTAAANGPALALYESYRFTVYRRWSVGSEKLELVKLRREPAPGLHRQLSGDVRRLNPTIRGAQASDASCLAVLATQVWLHTYATAGISPEIANYTLTQLTPEKYLSVLDDASSHLLVAEYGGNLIGFAVVKFGEPCPANSKSCAELQTLYVQAHFVGQGVGRQLLQAAEAIASTPLWLTVNVSNANAIAFYSRQGYTKVGTAYFVLGESQHENHVLIGHDA